MTPADLRKRARAWLGAQGLISIGGAPCSCERCEHWIASLATVLAEVRAEEREAIAASATHEHPGADEVVRELRRGA